MYQNYLYKKLNLLELLEEEKEFDKTVFVKNYSKIYFR